MTLDVAAAQWFDEVGQFLKSANDCERAIDLLCDCMGPATRLREIDGARIQTAIQKRKLIPTVFKSREGVKTRPPSNATINRQIVEMTRRILYRAELWGAVSLRRIDWGKVTQTEGKPREREISDDENDRLEAAVLRPYWKDFRTFLGTYGVRLGEMFFHPSEVRVVDGQVSIRINDRKDGSTYSLDLDADDGRLMLARKSRALAAGFDTVWYSERGGRLTALTYSGARSALRRAIMRAGIHDLTIHDHRHDVATKTTRQFGIVVAQSMLGHSDISTTRRYVKVAARDRVEAASAMKSRRKSREDASDDGNTATNQKDAV